MIKSLSLYRACSVLLSDSFYYSNWEALFSTGETSVSKGEKGVLRISGKVKNKEIVLNFFPTHLIK